MFFDRCHRAAILTVLVTFGLVAVPVECSVAAGPHSVFISAQSVAVLQGAPAASVSDRAQMHHAPAAPELSHGAGRAMEQHPRDPVPAASSGHDAQSLLLTADASTDVGTTGSAPARPAGFSVDAVVTLALPGTTSEPAALSPLVGALTDVQLQPDPLLTGPEPPPP